MRLPSGGTAKCLLAALALVLCLIAYVHQLDLPGLRAEEPRRAVVAQETLLGEHYLVPHINGRPYYNKPPFYNWVLAANFTVLGSMDEWAVRLPGIVSIWLSALLVFALARSSLGSGRALVAALLYLTAGDLFFYGAINAGEIDLFYSLVVSVQAALIFILSSRHRWWSMFILSYLLTGVGLLTKGLPSLAFQGFTLLAVLLYFGRWRMLVSWAHVAGIALLLVLMGAYLYAYDLQADLRGYLVNLYMESSQRSANQASLWDILWHLPAFPILVAKLLLPWSALLLLLLNKNYWPTYRAPVYRLSMVFILANIWLYWISPDIRNRYLYMFFPFLILLLEPLAHSLWAGDGPRWMQRFFALITALAAAFMAALPWLPTLTGGASVLPVALPIAAAIALMALGQWQWPRLGVYFMVAALALLRIGYNTCILPQVAASADAAYYREQVQRMAAMAAGEQVYYSGKPYTFFPQVKLAGYALAADTLRTPPLLPYEVPYYYTLSSGHLLLYSGAPASGQWILSHSAPEPPCQGPLLLEFEDRWTGDTLYFYRCTASGN